ncbi:DUF4097 family beta strand repeat-containing protein [Streptomyces sp. NPDC007100]|uniref:DUF4097 family beta strand repeat-containing protein n=1 Tax=Streptomyces sp. NPDC007100 TaxID=3155602 RepID=UPI0033EF2F2F
MTGHRTTTRPGHRTTRTALACAALVTVAVAVTGCELTEKVTKSERTYMVDGNPTKLDVTTPGGNIKVVADEGTGGRVKVTERFEYGKRKPTSQHSLVGGSLKLTASDCGNTMGRCDVAYEVRVPKTVAVSLETDGGTIDVKGLAGNLGAKSSGGDIDVEGCTAKQASLKTDGGNIDATFGAAPDRLEGYTAGGNVRVRLPEGRYAVDATTDGGDRRVAGGSDSGSPHKVKVHSDGGNVDVSAGS